MMLDRLKSLLANSKPAITETHERRGDPRKTVLLKAEVIPIRHCAEIKIVNASRTGFAGETTVALRPGRPIIFTVKDNQFHQGTIRWVRGWKFGVEFDDALAILGCAKELDPGPLASHTVRARRYPVQLAGQIVVESPSCIATVRDISQSGMRLELGGELEIGQQLLIRLPNRPLLLMSVRWRAYQLVGVESAERMETMRLVYACE